MYQMAPKTRRLVELFAMADYGATFTYAEVLEATECDLTGSDRQRIYTVVRVLEREHMRTLTNVRGVGYKVAHPVDSVHLMDERQFRAGKQLVRAQRIGESTDRIVLAQTGGPTASAELADKLAHVALVQQSMKADVNSLKARMKRVEDHIGLDSQEPVDSTAGEDTES